MGTMNQGLPYYDAKTIQDDVEDDTDEEVSDVESDSETEDNVKLSEPSKDAIYNRDGLMDKLQDISWPENVEWLHKLAIDVEQEQEVDVNDDLTRELAFYTQALEGTRKAFEKVEPMGLPFLRPVDYYAEMVKSDIHMEKIKSKLLIEKKNIEESEERRKARESKKLAKEVQAQKLKDRTAQKKTEIEAVKKWRKQRKDSGFADKDGDMKLPFEDGEEFGRPSKRRPGVSPGDRSGGKAKQDWKKGGKKRVEKKQMKRETRDSKFGNGGRKGLKKQNTADSLDNFKGSNKGGNRGGGDFKGSNRGGSRGGGDFKGSNKGGNRGGGGRTPGSNKRKR